ncbi:uncharacterized protein LOC108666527 [Hyalella azteca]|uniref:Uncharacterized protein LOC108666527 n=1 Tax=Hyalella azteca TaxID=294128 RepID=A0A8B7N4Y9_HYAAZ|nr:uncharacterized protein LOC108666527 [Hyalella azteca]
MGKPVFTAGVFDGYSSASMLTAGTTCYNTMEDCFCSPDYDNWAVVDLQTSLPIRTVVITGPAFDDVEYFRNIVVRAGNIGNDTDPIIGTTPNINGSDYQQYTLAIASGSIRYIRLQYEANIAAICFCKLQAFL